MVVSQSSVSRVIKEHVLADQGIKRPLKRLGSQNLPSERTAALAKKLDSLTSKDNPPSQIAMARKFGVSRRTIDRVLTENLRADRLMKRKTHALSDKQALQRLEKEPRFLKILRGDR